MPSPFFGGLFVILFSCSTLLIFVMLVHRLLQLLQLKLWRLLNLINHFGVLFRASEVQILIATVKLFEQIELLLVRKWRIIYAFELNNSLDAECAQHRNLDFAGDPLRLLRLHDDGRQFLDFLHFWVDRGKQFQSLENVRLMQITILAKSHIYGQLLFAYGHIFE